MAAAGSAGGRKAFRSRPTSGSAGDAKHTRFVVDLTRKIDVRAFTLATRFRVVVDLPQVTFQLPAARRAIMVAVW